MRPASLLIVASLLSWGCTATLPLPPPDNRATRVSDCYGVAEARAEYQTKLDEILVTAGEFSSIISNHPAEGAMFESISSIDGEITSVLLRLPRPGLDWNEARRKNLRYYELGSDQGHNIPSGDKALLRLADELNSGLEEITPLIGPAMRVGC